MIKIGLDESMPDGWGWVVAQDYIDIRDGTHDSPKPLADGVPLVTSKNLVNGKVDFSNCNYISNQDHEAISRRSAVDDGDILYAMIGTIGNPVIVKKTCDFSIKNVALFKFSDSIFYNRYIYHFLNSNITKDQFNRVSRGGTQKFVSLGNIRSLLIPVPFADDPEKSLRVQKRIADILDKADGIRRKRQQAIDLADEFLRATFLDMFGDPVSNPANWPVKKLSDLSDKILNGTTPKGGSKIYVDQGVKFLRSQNVWKNNIILDNLVYLDEATHKLMAESSLMYKDILMTKTGRINTENSSLGRAALFLGVDGSANINGHVYLIRLKKEILNEFVVFILTTREYRDYIRSVSVGGIDKRQINKGHLEDFPIIFPDVELQEKFIKQISKVNKIQITARSFKNKSNKIFESLSQKAFLGELT